jgi:hypothetical protein
MQRLTTMAGNGVRPGEQVLYRDMGTARASQREARAQSTELLIEKRVPGSNRLAV